MKKQSSQRSAISGQLKTKHKHAPTEPDCMYWLKHDEAAMLLAIVAKCSLTREDQRTREIQVRTVKKMAKQWFLYQKDTEAAPAKVVVAMRRAIVKLARKVKAR